MSINVSHPTRHNTGQGGWREGGRDGKNGWMGGGWMKGWRDEKNE